MRFTWPASSSSGCQSPRTFATFLAAANDNGRLPITCIQTLFTVDPLRSQW